MAQVDQRGQEPVNEDPLVSGVRAGRGLACGSACCWASHSGPISATNSASTSTGNPVIGMTEVTSGAAAVPSVWLPPVSRKN
ncbi:hypothetical protein [Streptosporangium sp. NPDC002721]|uniref:hypothetical protein n=1 Tax=Streptosporangium sp. NPDC002721 TaxID=3366188 RepID=UPI0036D1C1B0